VHHLEIKALNITDARCNHEVYKGLFLVPQPLSPKDVNKTTVVLIVKILFRKKLGAD